MPVGKVILPKGSVFKPRQMERAIQNTLTNVAKNIKVDFGVTTQTWQHKPKFEVTTPATYERRIATDDEVYAMLDAGTRPHIIRPKKRRILRFFTPFQSKTLPERVMSRPGTRGTDEVFSKVVRHPGTKPRHWIKVIQKKWQGQAPATFQRALNAEFR